MNGSAVILHLCAIGPSVGELVDPEAEPSRISGDVLAVGVAMPALNTQKIGSRDLKVFSSTTRRVTQRVQVTCHGETIAQVAELLRAVRTDCDGQRLAALGVLTDIDVQTDGEGPEGFDPVSDRRVATQDFRVSYNEPR